MTSKSLGHLYRSATAQPSAAASRLDADELAGLADGTLDEAARDRVAANVAESTAHARLVRMLRELAPASEALAAAGKRSDVAHRGRDTRPTIAAQPRRWPRIALAAAAAAFLAVVTLRLADHDGRSQGTVADDRIFSPASDQSLAHEGHRTRKDDTVFRSDFREDKVFKTDFNGG